MAALTCEICGGKLVGKPGGVFECDSCGMEYSTEWAKAKIQEIRGTVQVEGTVEVTGTVKVEGGANAESLLKLGQIALQDGKWEQADASFDKVLEIAPENAEAYLGKSCSRFKFHGLEEIQTAVKQGWKPRFLWWERNNDLQRAILFSSPALAERIEATKAAINSAYTSHITRLAEVRKENAPAQNLINFRDNVYAKGYIAGVKTDGSVLYEEFYHREPAYEVSSPKKKLSAWRDIVALTGWDKLYGLKEDHTVVRVGGTSKKNLTDVVAIWDNSERTVILKTDGTVTARGKNEYGENNVSGWSGITAIAAGPDHTVGLKTDGTVVAVGDNKHRQCDVSEWTDIVAIDASYHGTAGLRADGTVVAAGFSINTFLGEANIVAIAFTDLGDLVGLKADGTIVTKYVGDTSPVSKWKNVVAIQHRNGICVGLTSTGKVLTTSYEFEKLVAKWKLFSNIKTLEKERETARQQIREADAERHRRQDEERAKRKAALEKERAQRRAALDAERTALQNEFASLKGLFSGKRRKEIEVRLAAITKELEE